MRSIKIERINRIASTILKEIYKFGAYSKQDKTELFIEIIIALYLVYTKLTNNYDIDLLGFTHIINRAVVNETIEMSKFREV